jgi:hypothetical protein
MTALSSGRHFISGLALHFGAFRPEDSLNAKAKKLKRRRKAGDSRYTPLSVRQKKELLDSIRQDDWSE